MGLWLNMLTFTLLSYFNYLSFFKYGYLTINAYDYLTKCILFMLPVSERLHFSCKVS